MNNPTAMYKRINGGIITKVVSEEDSIKMMANEGWKDSPAKVDECDNCKLNLSNVEENIFKDVPPLNNKTRRIGGVNK